MVDRLAHEYGLKDELDGRSTARPLALVRDHGRTMLLLEDPGGDPLGGLLGRPMEMGRFLRLAAGLSGALRQLHERGLIHKDIKPGNVLVNSATGQAWLTGFGIASRLRASVNRLNRLSSSREHSPTWRQNRPDE
jgi:serine/threonine protein kinase